MSMFDGMNISATGMTAQRFRMDVISENIANIRSICRLIQYVNIVIDV